MKAVLVIDVDDKYLGKEISLIKFTDDNAIYCREELKPLPEKLVPFGYIDVGNEDGLYEKGYNACIDDITGETE